MPRVFRSMMDEAGRPKIGPSASMLGVRLPPDPAPDVFPDPQGLVHPGRGGMSVAPDWRLLPPWRLPRRLQGIVAEATGRNALRLWSWGDGPFEDGPLALGLAIRVDSPQHGLIEPDAVMPLTDYQSALTATRDGWRLVAEDFA